MRFESFKTTETYEVIEKCRSDKVKHWDVLMNKYAPTVKGIANKYGWKYGIEEDIEQEAWMKIYDKYEQFRGGTHAELKGWMAQVTVNTASTLVKDKVKNTCFEYEEAFNNQTGSSQPENDVVTKGEVERLVKEVKQRSILEQEIFKGMYYQSDAVEEAERLGITRGNYDSRKSKLRDKLRTKIDPIEV